MHLYNLCNLNNFFSGDPLQVVLQTILLYTDIPTVECLAKYHCDILLLYYVNSVLIL